MNQPTRIVAMVAGVSFLGLGLWAFVDARSFYEQLAAFPPYNPHFLHDIGAFQIGIGGVLLLSVIWSDSVGAALGGVALGATFHAVAHFLDRDLGGKVSDPWLLSALAGVLVVAAVARRRT